MLILWSVGNTHTLTHSHTQRRHTEREVGRIHDDLQRLKKTKDTHSDETNRQRNAAFAANEQLDKFKVQMNWSQDELLQWSLASKQKVHPNKQTHTGQEARPCEGEF